MALDGALDLVSIAVRDNDKPANPFGLQLAWKNKIRKPAGLAAKVDEGLQVKEKRPAAHRP